jgi:hypothetical protein
MLTKHEDHAKERSDLKACLEEVCQTCTDKPEEIEEVKGEEVTTQEVTLVFAWPKKKGRKLHKGKDPFKELHMRRVMRVTDFDIQMIEGPTIKKSIQHSPKHDSKECNVPELKAIEMSNDSTDSKKYSMIESKDNNDDEETKDGVEEILMDDIITDIDVKVSTVKYGPNRSSPIKSEQFMKGRSVGEIVSADLKSFISPEREIQEVVGDACDMTENGKKDTPASDADHTQIDADGKEMIELHIGKK